MGVINVKNVHVLYLFLAILSSSSIQTKQKKASLAKFKKTKQIKDKTCQNIRDLFEEMNALTSTTDRTDVTMFLKDHKDFFEAHNAKIKRHSQTMDTFFISGEKRRAKREIKFIQAFYIANSIADVENEDQIANFVKENYDKSVWYINSIAHVQKLNFNFTGFADQVRAIIKFLKKDKIMNDVIINKELLYSLINKLESILYTVTEQGEHKIEKRKQRLHLAAEFAKSLLRSF